MRPQVDLTAVLLFVICSTTLGQRSYDVDVLADTFGFDASTKKSVALEDLKQGCRKSHRVWRFGRPV